MAMIINHLDAKALLKQCPKGQFFSVKFNRVAPKCLHCNKANKKWNGLLKCPICGAPLSYTRDALGQLGVHNPHNTAIAPKGVGETFAEKLQKNIIGFYDNQIMQYRECLLDNITHLKIGGVEYVVK